MGNVTRILEKIEDGDLNASDGLLPLVYQELRQLAADRLAKEPSGQTLQPTALVHEAYIRLVDKDRAGEWDSRGHFFAAAAESMRRILIDRARSKLTTKRGRAWKKVDGDFDVAVEETGSRELLALDEALERFQQEDPEKAELVKLRYFCGMELKAAAAMMGISRATASRHWTFAKAWLYAALEEADAAEKKG